MQALGVIDERRADAAALQPRLDVELVDGGPVEDEDRDERRAVLGDPELTFVVTTFRNQRRASCSPCGSGGIEPAAAAARRARTYRSAAGSASACVPRRIVGSSLRA